MTSQHKIETAAEMAVTKRPMTGHPGAFIRDTLLVLQRAVPQFQPVAKHQAVERDLAVVVAERITHAAIMDAIHAAAPQGMLRSAVLFDVYRPKGLRAGEVAPTGSLAQGEKSLAVRLTLGRDEATLTEAEIESAVQAVVARLTQDTGARLRV